jgi:hypothetical protein
MPIFITKFMVPINRHAPLIDAFFQSNRVDRLGFRLTPFAPGGAERDAVRQTEGHSSSGTQSGPGLSPRDGFHMPFDRPKTLRNAITPVGTGRHRIGVDHIRIKPDIG